MSVCALEYVHPGVNVRERVLTLKHTRVHAHTNTLQERQVRLDCESERVKRSQIKKQLMAAKENYRKLATQLDVQYERKTKSDSVIDQPGQGKGK